MSEQLNEHEIRVQKLQQLQAAGVQTYPTKFPRTHNIQELVALAEQDPSTGSGGHVSDTEILMQHGSSDRYMIAGRLMLFRTMGKLSFGTIRDVTGDIQIAFVKGLCTLHTGSELTQELHIDGNVVSAYKFSEKYLDIADFIGVKGELFVTKHGELTLFVNEFQLLSKALRPLGDKRHGIEDMEKRLRKRYLDTTMNTESKEMLLRRSRFWQAMRTFLLEKAFMEVETPILETTTGGADANPFATHHQALDLDVFLRISCGELWQKRLLVGGFEKTFEIGRIFRNEGMSPEHAQDYTQMENYWAYADYRDMMELVKHMYLYIIDTVYKKRTFSIRGYEVNFDNQREEIDYTTIIKEKTGIDIWTASNEEIEATLSELKVNFDPFNRIRLVDTLRKYCRKQLSGPAFLMNVPKFMSPLAKSSPDNPELTERFQVIIAGSEVGNGFSELNDPQDQKERFTEQQAMRDAGDDEAQMADWEYVEALEHCMPPAAGFGVSERLFCFLEDLPIREAQYFPLMKPEGAGEGTGKSKETKVAVALVNTGANLETWQEMNTIAHLNAAFGARSGKSLFMQDNIKTQDNQKINLNIQHAIMIKEIDNSQEILNLVNIAKEQNVEIAEFTREMIETTNDAKIIEITGGKKHDEVEYLGVLLFGTKKKVEQLTKQFTLYTGNTNVISTAKNEVSVVEKSSGSGNPSTSSGGQSVGHGIFPTTDQAHDLVEKYLTDTRRHCEQVGVIMKWFANKLGEDEHIRYLAGLLHDIDWDHIAKDADKHLKDEFETIMDEIQAPQTLRDDIKSHGERLTGVPVDSTIRKYLASVDELSGFMYAYSLMRPTGFEGMKAKGVNKRIKDKSFAAGVDREHLKNCEKYLDIPLAEFIPDMLEAFGSID